MLKELASVVRSSPDVAGRGGHYRDRTMASSPKDQELTRRQFLHLQADRQPPEWPSVRRPITPTIVRALRAASRYGPLVEVRSAWQ